MVVSLRESGEILFCPKGAPELRRSACASLLVVEVLANLSNLEEEKKSKFGFQPHFSLSGF
jgi:hypothetical protein